MQLLLFVLREILTVQFVHQLIGMAMNRMLPSTKVFEDTIKNYWFKDVWRSQHPLLGCYTWCRCNDGMMSMARLDRFYVNKLMLNVVSSTQIVPTGFPDHSLISMSFKLPFPPSGSAYWSLNTRLLQDKGFNDAFRVIWRKFGLLDLILIVSGCGGISQKTIPRVYKVYTVPKVNQYQLIG